MPCSPDVDTSHIYKYNRAAHTVCKGHVTVYLHSTNHLGCAFIHAAKDMIFHDPRRWQIHASAESINRLRCGEEGVVALGVAGRCLVCEKPQVMRLTPEVKRDRFVAYSKPFIVPHSMLMFLPPKTFSLNFQPYRSLTEEDMSIRQLR